ncbi:PREDICTED: uncharacterized protein LOC109173479 [Ipomoea nil]|uniref:uncharacterized protein LOC109173479 n=1 Tax=Ipomoea nil TaxID=35883 RepID=UPI0009009395|nr:PREDICTED: uncharacterized protein LOC109173479 [Ipomoea nil]
MGFEGLLCVEQSGMGGGLALFWRDAAMATLLSYSTNHIDVSVSLPDTPEWRLTCFYGESDQNRRQESWDLLRELRDRSTLPWVTIGDFNDITCQSEKRGPHAQPTNLIEGFNDALMDCQLFDLGMEGSRFTWERGRGTDAWVEERLDRAVATHGWLEIYDSAVVRNLLTMEFDHNAILLDMESRTFRRAKKRFRFESAWLQDEGCHKAVDQVWRSTLGMNFQDRITECRSYLGKWGEDYFRRNGKQIKCLRHKLENLRDSREQQDVADYIETEGTLQASARRRRNQLHRIKNPEGQWLEGTELNGEVLRYYSDIFQSTGINADIFNHVPSRVSPEMNATLALPFTIVEIKEALFSMAPEKAPGPDGMSPAFYQHFWPILGHDLFIFITHCLLDRSLPPGLNDSNIVLIPKKKCPEKVSDLRPIALCNVVYKVLAKALANRMKSLLHSVVSESQSAFVPDRLLTDNIIVAGEVGHYLKRKTSGAMGWTALKLDMAKAYDRMEWGFLEGMLTALGFDRSWTHLLMMGVKSVIYHIQVNGETVGTISPTRGIRQGDPISPYLFILCVEGLSVLLQQAERQGDIHGIRIARGAPAVTHLFFADDSLLFFRATSTEAQTIRNCLDTYSAVSGQVINYEKSNIMFSINTTLETRSSVMEFVAVRECNDLGRYLGLPSFLGRNKSATFCYIEQRIRERIGGWQQRLLSRAGKEVLLKSIAQALPIFTMSVFYLPQRLCDTLERLFNRYWWGGGGGSTSRGIHWLSWHRLCVPKAKGGLGFKRLHEFNIALLAKQGWRLLIYPNSLVSRLLRAKYYPNNSFLNAQMGHNPSYLWRSIMAGQELLKRGAARRIGNGEGSKIWEWPWLADTIHPRLTTSCINHLRDQPVASLLTSQGTWDVAILHGLFTPKDVPRILATPLSPTLPDSWRWLGDTRGMYTARHGYKLLTESNTSYDWNDSFTAWDRLWKLPIPPKVKNLLWRCVRGIMPVKEVLKQKHVWIGGGCAHCDCQMETAEHVFCECTVAMCLWENGNVLHNGSILEFLDALIKSAPMHQIIHAAAIFWVLWKARNDKIWRDTSISPESLLIQVHSLQALWSSIKQNSGEATTSSASSVLWTPPPANWLKCNVDAALFATEAGFGAVVRNHDGCFVAAKGGRLGYIQDPLLAEASAIAQALGWLQSLGLNNIILETDCLMFSSTFNSGNSDFSYVGSIVKQCVQIATNIGTVQVRHVRRSANHVAHVLARATDSPSVLGSWLVNPPLCIAALLSY